MVSASPLIGSRSSVTPASLAKFSELVKKIGTSPSLSKKRREKAAKKKLNRVIKEQRRYAKVGKLRAVAVTLTYANNGDCSPTKVSDFIDRLRTTMKRRGHILPYIWVLERADRLHYHLLLWLPRSYILDSAKLAQRWPWGSTWVESCRRVKDWGRYITKFNSSAKLPKGSRLFGCGGLDSVGKIAVSRAALPCWLLKLLPAGHCARRCPGGGWVDTTTGEVYRSPYLWTPWGPRRRPTLH